MSDMRSDVSVSSGVLPFQKLFERLGEMLRPFTKLDPFDAAIYTTLVLLCIEDWHERQLLMFCAFALIVRPLARSGIYWICIGVLYVASHWQEWYTTDNHAYLITYWCLAIALSLFSKTPGKTLAKSARWMVALIFLLTILWKVSSADFMTGRFFEFSILLDPRFSVVGLLLGISGEALAANREAMSAYVHSATLADDVVLTTTPLVPIAAKLMIAWTLLVEGAVAVLFLMPKSKVGEFWRHGSLLLFIYTTYLLASVSGFGWTLTALGMSQVKPNAKPLYMAAYLFAFLWIFMAKNPGIRGVLMHLNLL